jgi:hypothetical protein
VPGDDCKQELIITDDILAVLDMFDKELDKNSNRLPGSLPIEQTTTTYPIKHETLVTTTNSLSTILPTTTMIPPIVKATDPSTTTEDNVDYNDFVRFETFFEIVA